VVHGHATLEALAVSRTANAVHGPVNVRGAPGASPFLRIVNLKGATRRPSDKAATRPKTQLQAGVVR
jgi:hypothetical protein